MRRSLLALTGLMAGTTLLVSLKSAPGASRLPGQVAADDAAAVALARASATPAPARVDGLPAAPDITIPTPGGGGTLRASASAPAAPRAGTAPTRPPASPAPKPSPAPGRPAVIMGDSVFTEFGFVTVGITTANPKITDVIADELPGDDARSISISEKAGPVLRQRALTAQSARIDSVSGATYTSEAYRQSLQSAIDKAGLATR